MKFIRKLRSHFHSKIPQNHENINACLSSDGRYIVFESVATNLVGGDTDGRVDIYIHDRSGGETNLISINADCVSGNNHSGSMSISSDGRFVAFESDANLLVSDDFNCVTDIFIHEYIDINSVDITLRGTAVTELADLAIDKTANNIEVSPGTTGSDLTTFTLTVTNNGPDAIDAVAFDQLPAAMVIASGQNPSASLGSYDVNSGEWTIGPLSNGQVETLTIPVHLGPYVMI